MHSRHAIVVLFCISGTCSAWTCQFVVGLDDQSADTDLFCVQGKYDKLTFWEQFDDGVQNTGTRKFFLAVPVITFLLATHGTDYRRQPLFLNLVALVVPVVSKFPALHKVRIFGINKH